MVLLTRTGVNSHRMSNSQSGRNVGLQMERRVLKFCCATAVALVLSCVGHAFASEDTAPSSPDAKRLEAKSRPSATSHGRLATRSHRIVQSAKDKDKKAAAAKPQPWFDVDPGRAARPPDPAEADAIAKSRVPPAKWAKDSFDFQTKVTGSNDFQLLPRFDSNQNPQGLGGEAGVNLHF